jgi:predicted RNA polymerase sigma factor
MEIQASRTRARIGPTGEPILLLDQNRAHWDLLLIRRGLAAIDRATNILNTNRSPTDLSPAPKNTPTGPYLLQAEIAACHARAHTPEATDWPRIVSLYTELAHLTPSPVIELNRAVAVSMANGPQAALDLVEALATDPSLDRYHLLPSVRADLLYKLGRHHEARTQFELAASLTQNTRERVLLLNRAASCRD